MVLPQDLGGLGVDPDGSDASFGLRGLDLARRRSIAVTAEVSDRALNRELRRIAFEVDVLPTQSGDLAAAHPRRCLQPDDGRAIRLSPLHRLLDRGPYGFRGWWSHRVRLGRGAFDVLVGLNRIRSLRRASLKICERALVMPFTDFGESPRPTSESTKRWTSSTVIV